MAHHEHNAEIFAVGDLVVYDSRARDAITGECVGREVDGPHRVVGVSRTDISKLAPQFAHPQVVTLQNGTRIIGSILHKHLARESN